MMRKAIVIFTTAIFVQLNIVAVMDIIGKNKLRAVAGAAGRTSKPF
jgi:hypothetical protein